MQDKLTKIRDLFQQDVGNRGLAKIPEANLITACANDYFTACQSLTETKNLSVAIVTGFFIPHGQPSCGESDGPPGAVYLAKAIIELGGQACLLTDAFCQNALEVGVREVGLQDVVPVRVFLENRAGWPDYLKLHLMPFLRNERKLTHLITIERVGPNHTEESLRSQLSSEEEMLVQEYVTNVPEDQQDRCYNASGKDITDLNSPSHLLFDYVRQKFSDIVTIGIGDGGNELGMGKIPWPIIRNNIKGGAKLACRVSTDHLIVAGISNWGAYGLAIGALLQSGRAFHRDSFSVESESNCLQAMMEKGPLVDGVTGKPTLSVDTVPLERYLQTLREMTALL